MKNVKKLEKAYRIQTEEWKPKKKEVWPIKKLLKIGRNNVNKDDFLKDIEAYTKKKKWVFPSEKIHFIADLHADADALYKSFIGAGFIKKTGINDEDFEVLTSAKDGKIIIGGDCLDKGPSNLRLLDAIKLMKDAGLNITVLAGNHDIRTYVGISQIEDKRQVAEHVFVRMGRKTIPLFREIYKKYLHGQIDPDKLLSKEEVEYLLFPSDEWFDIYAEKMDGLIPPIKIEKETKRIREKIADIRDYLERTGFSHGMLYETFKKAQSIFCDLEGDYGWFFSEMKVAVQEGSFLFVHAGLDDFSVDWLGQVGAEGINEKFKILLRNDSFELYHGHIGNIFRTKYRDVDFPFTARSVKKLHQWGVNAVVHGHRNTIQGHRLTIKRGLMNFECDTSLDRATRKVEDLPGYGASWMTIYPKGIIEAYSTDYPAIKVFDVEKLGGKLAKQLPEIKLEEYTSKVKLAKKSKVAVSFKEDRLQAEHIFRDLAKDIQSGSIRIHSEEQSLEAELPEELEIIIKGEADKHTGSLNIQLKWNNSPVQEESPKKADKKAKSKSSKKKKK